MTSREIIFGVVGLVIGTGLGVILTKKHYEKKCVDTINEELEKQQDTEYSYIAGLYKSIDKEDKSKNSEPVDKMSYKRDYKKAESKDYQAMYNRAKDLAENAMNEAEEEGELDNGDESFEEFDRARNHGRKPDIVSEDALDEADGYYDKVDLFYYAYDDILTDENENVIEDKERIVGDCLKEFGFEENGSDFLFVRNYDLSTIYEIQKFDASFESQQEEYDG